MNLTGTNRPSGEAWGKILIVLLVLLGLLAGVWQSRYGGISASSASMPTSTYPPPTPSPPLTLVGTPLPQSSEPISVENVTQVVPLARWGEGTIHHIAWSPDGTLLVAATTLGVYIYEAQTLELLQFLDTNVAINQVAFAPDGATLAAAGADYAVWLWQVPEMRLLSKLAWHTDEVGSLAFSPDSSLLLSGSADQTARLWQVADGELLQTFKAVAGKPESERALQIGLQLNEQIFSRTGTTDPLAVSGVAFDQSGEMIATGLLGGQILLWHKGEEKPFSTLSQPEPLWSLGRIAFAPEGDGLVALVDSGAWYRWQLEDQMAPDHQEPLFKANSLDIAPDGASLALGGADGRVQLQRFEDGEPLMTFGQEGGIVVDVAFSPDGTALAVALVDEIQLWRPADCSGQASECQPFLRTKALHLAGVQSVAFARDGQSLAAGTENSKAWLWQTKTGVVQEEKINHVVPLQTGLIPAKRGSEEEILSWPSPAGVLLRSTFMGGSAVSLKAFSPDRTLLATVENGADLQILRVKDEVILHEVSTGGFVTGLAFSPDNRLLAVGGVDGMIRLWGIKEESWQNSWPASQSWISALAFSPDGTSLAAGSLDTTIQLWQAPEGILVQAFTGNGSSVNSLAFSPEGSLLAVTTLDRSIQLWRVSDGALVHLLRGHLTQVVGLAFSADGTLLASGSTDGTIRLWGLQP